LQNKKKSYMITAVMKMRTYQTIDRLQSSQYIGQQHVAVKQHRMKSYPQHWHNYFEIELVLSGSGVQTYNGKEYPIARGDVYLLTPVDFHGIEGDVELLNISFDEVCLPRDMLSFLSDPKSEKISRLSAEEFDRFCMAAALLQHECQVSGTCTGTHQPHAWVIIAFDGEDYFFDPQWENNYHTREIYDKDMFMLSMDEIWYWTYQWIE